MLCTSATFGAKSKRNRPAGLFKTVAFPHSPCGNPMILAPAPYPHSGFTWLFGDEQTTLEDCVEL
jgi:hypothetical protein